MLITHNVLYCRAKLALEVRPSGLTSSVELGEPSVYKPPINKTGPPSPSTAQQRCSDLHSPSLTEVWLKAPVRGFSFRQDSCDEYNRCVEVSPPPQSICPQRVWRHLAPPGRSASVQECRVRGLNTSTLTPALALGRPPAIMKPGTKYIYQLTNIHWRHMESIYHIIINNIM